MAESFHPLSLRFPLNIDSDFGGKLVHNDDIYRRELTLLFKDLRSMAISLLEFYTGKNHHYYVKYHDVFSLLLEHLDSEFGLGKDVDNMLEIAHLYDANEHTPANGYRSLVKVVHKCLLHIQILCRYIAQNKDAFFFRCGHYYREISAYVSCLGQLRACLYYVSKLPKYCKEGYLFGDENFRGNDEAERLMSEAEGLDCQPFYGRALGFQYCQSFQRPFKLLHVTMATYSEMYKPTASSSALSSLVGSVLKGGRYFMNPELRAKQVSETTKTADIKFCKGFWGLAETEIIQLLPDYVCPSVKINEVLTLAAESFEVPRADGNGMVTIFPPKSHHGVGPVNVRLLSNVYREGQELLKPYLCNPRGAKCFTGTPAPKSPYLIIQCHGGGFVAQSSKSHELYLRDWANDLEIPILAIDYSLAPESPYPRALEECFFAYAWAVHNCHKLGSTAQQVCIVGDSAGGNLALALSFWAAENGIRLATGILAAYTPTMIRYVPAPSKVLSIMDPLLPVGMMLRCLSGSTGEKICVVGDSAGGNLFTAVLFKAIESGIRVIDGMLAAYTPFIIKLVPGPARLLTLMDPLIPVGMMLRCLTAYTGIDEDKIIIPEKRTTASNTPIKLNAQDEKDNTNTHTITSAMQDTLDTEIIAVHSFGSKSAGQNLGLNCLAQQNSRTDQSNRHTESAQEIIPETQLKQIKLKGRKPRNLQLDKLVEKDETLKSPTETNNQSAIEIEKDDVIQSEDKIKSHKKLVRLCENTLANKSESCRNDKDKFMIDFISDNNHVGESSEKSNQQTSENQQKLTINFTPTTSVPKPISSPRRLMGHMRSPSSPNFHSMTAHNTSRHMTWSPPEMDSVWLDVIDTPPKPNPLQKFHHVIIPEDPHISPLLATDDMLRRLPPVYLVTTHLDPILDDSVTFAKRLQSINHDVHLDVLEDLPHGFLNFVLISKEAKQGSDLCVARIRQIFGISKPK